MQFVCGELEKVWLDDASFVMSFLWPGVGKQQINSGKRCIRYLISQHFDGIVGNQPEVVDICPIRLDQAMTHTWLVYLDANEILTWVVSGSQHKTVAIAEPNLKSPVSVSTKNFP